MRLRTVLKSARSQIRKGKGTTHKEFWQSIDKPPTKARKKASKRAGGD